MRSPVKKIIKIIISTLLVVIIGFTFCIGVYAGYSSNLPIITLFYFYSKIERYFGIITLDHDYERTGYGIGWKNADISIIIENGVKTIRAWRSAARCFGN